MAGWLYRTDKFNPKDWRLTAWRAEWPPLNDAFYICCTHSIWSRVLGTNTGCTLFPAKAKGKNRANISTHLLTLFGFYNPRSAILFCVPLASWYKLSLNGAVIVPKQLPAHITQELLQLQQWAQRAEPKVSGMAPPCLVLFCSDLSWVTLKKQFPPR